MKLKPKDREVTAVRWEGQKDVGPTADWMVEQGMSTTVQTLKGPRDVAEFDLLPEGATTPNGIEYVTEAVGPSRARLSGHGLQVLCGAHWVAVSEGDYIVVDDELAVVPAVAMAALYDEVTG